MPGFIADVVSNSKFQFAATAVISGVTVASLIFGFQEFDKQRRLSRLRNPDASPSPHQVGQINSWGGSEPSVVSPVDKEDERNQALARRAQQGDFDEELILEQLARNQVFLTPEGLQKLRDSFVIVVGCGGVGSHCAAALARSGVSRLRLIDFDQVTLSSLNRHAVATLADVGTPKVKCLERRLIAIAPWVKFDLCLEKFDGAVAARLLGAWKGRKPDFVIDAIDNIDSKVELLKYCYDSKLPVISSMGAGCKSDPTRITIGDIGSSTDDGLSRATRRRLKLQGVTEGIPVIYSTEKTGEGKAQLLPLPEEEFQKGSVGDLGVMANFRVRILPVLGTMPAIFGLTAANHAILKITGYPIQYVPAKGRDKMYDGILTYVQGSEDKLARLYHPGLTGLRTSITVGDVAFLTEELYRGRSVASGLASRVVLIRWRKPEQSPVAFLGEHDGEHRGAEVQKSSIIRLRDLVCLTREEAARHERLIFKEGIKLEDVYDQRVIEAVAEKQEEAEKYEKYR